MSLLLLCLTLDTDLLVAKSSTTEMSERIINKAQQKYRDIPSSPGFAGSFNFQKYCLIYF